MIKLQSLILLAFISYSLQDNNCLVNFETCVENEQTKQSQIPHCIESRFSYNQNGEKEERCSICENNYAISEDDKNCIKVDNPISHCNYYYIMGEEIICAYCENGFIISGEGNNCVKIENPIAHCVEHYSSPVNDKKELFCDECEDGYYVSEDRKTCVEFKNCDDFSYPEGKVICDECKIGYAISFDGKSCKSFQNCWKLKNGDNKCDKCYEFYHPNTEGKCERTLCKEYNSQDICTVCYQGYYLN